MSDGMQEETVHAPDDSPPWGIDGLAHRVGILEGQREGDARRHSRTEKRMEIAESRLVRVEERADEADDIHREHRLLIDDFRAVLSEVRELLVMWNKMKSTKETITTITDGVIWIAKVAGVIGLLFAGLHWLNKI